MPSARKLESGPRIQAKEQEMAENEDEDEDEKKTAKEKTYGSNLRTAHSVREQPHPDPK